MLNIKEVLSALNLYVKGNYKPTKNPIQVRQSTKLPNQYSYTLDDVTGDSSIKLNAPWGTTTPKVRFNLINESLDDIVARFIEANPSHKLPTKQPVDGALIELESDCIAEEIEPVTVDTIEPEAVVSVAEEIKNSFVMSEFRNGDNRPLNKSKILVDGEIVTDRKKSNQLYEGNVLAFRYTLESLEERIKNLPINFAFSNGTLKSEFQNRNIVGKKGCETTTQNKVSRTKNCFEYSQNEAGVALLDCDSDDKSFDEIRNEIIKASPALKNVGMLAVGSSSSGVFVTGTEPPIRDKLQTHMFIGVTRASDIPAFGERIEYESWKSGLGKIDFAKNGSMLVRQLTDHAVHSPERLIYEAQPSIPDDGSLSLLPKKTKLYAGGLFDASSCALTEQEKKHFASLIANAKAIAKPKSEEIKSLYVEKETPKLKEKLIKQGKSEKDAEAIAKKVLDKRCNNILTKDHMLHFRDFGKVSVGDVLKDAKKYLYKELFDPLEDDFANASDNQAKVMYAKDSRGKYTQELIIRSYRHGETFFKLENTVLDSADTTAEIESEYIDIQEEIKQQLLTQFGEFQPFVDKAVAELNRDYAEILVGSHIAIMKTILNVETGRKERAFLNESDLNRIHRTDLIPVGYMKKTNQYELEKKSQIWLNSPNRVHYPDGFVFIPHKYVNGVEEKPNITPKQLNLWEGFSVNPIKGDWSIVRNHMLNVLCDGDIQSFDYLMSWCARGIQRPDKNGQVAVAFKGKKGTGKSSFANFYKDLFGQHGLQITNSKHLIGNFNAHMADCCFLFADEAFFAGNKEHESMQKALITESTIMIEQKGIDAKSMTNRLKIMMASNEDWVVPASGDDERRFFVLNVRERVEDVLYFDDLIKSFEDKNVQSAFLYDMMHHDVTNFKVQKVPETMGLKEQRTESLDSFCKYWVDVLKREYVFTTQLNIELFFQWEERVSTELIFKGYNQWCENMRTPANARLTDVNVGKHLARWYHKSRSHAPMPVGECKGDMGVEVITKPRATFYELGTLTAAREAFCTARKINIDDVVS